MSKSLGNSPDPLAMMDRFGADAVRFTMIYLTPTGQDLLFDEKRLETGKFFANKVWNAARLVSLQARRRGPLAGLRESSCAADARGPLDPVALRARGERA